MVSRTCAAQLGLSWEFVEYTEEKWKAISESDVFSQYLDFAGRCSSVAHIQDFLEIKELQKVVR